MEIILENRKMRKRIILTLSVCVLCFISTKAQPFQGLVFHDANNNGLKDKGERGIEGIRVSDGLNVTKTDKKGTFSLPGWEKIRFISVYQSKDYSCSKWYKSTADLPAKLEFAMRPKQKTEEVEFLQISDTETYEYRDWVDNLREYTRINKPAFLIHTGDICYKRGMKWHAESITSETLGVPVYYCLGNHDMVEGDYGEQFFEEHLGPAWYAFEEGNTLFMITPIMHGDYKPSFSREDIGQWMQNLLDSYPQKQSKIVFNHDLLTNGEHFIFKYGKEDAINFSEYNVRAWLYGHWHINMVKEHGGSGITSYGTAVAAKGGIDHSPSSFRVVNVDTSGETTSRLVWTYVDNEMGIVSPQKDQQVFKPGKAIKVSVNVYHSAASVKKVRCRIWPKGKSPSMHNLEELEKWKLMDQASDWNWQTNWEPMESGSYTVIVEADLEGGERIRKQQAFDLSPAPSKVITDENWENLLNNPEHNGNHETINMEKLSLAWTSNIGGNIFMVSPVIFKNNVITATFDDNNAQKGAIVALNATTGEEKWRFTTRNSIKNTIVVAQGLVLGTDMQGFVYAVDALSGELKWEKDLAYNRLPGYVSGMVTNGQIVYTGMGNTLCALDAATGKELWRNTGWNGGEGSVPTLTLANGVLVASAHWRALYGHHAETGELLWTKTDDGLRFRDGTVSFFDNMLWLVQNQKLFKLDPKTGKTLESFHTGMHHTSNSAPVVKDDLVFVGSTHPGVAALDKKSGAQYWSFETEPALFHTPPYSADKQQTVETSPLLLGEKLLVGGMDGNLWVLDAERGQVFQKFSFGAPILGTPAVSGNCIFTTDFAGNVSCFTF